MGKGVDKDASKAIPFLKKSAIRGDAVAQFQLAECYKNGEGVEEDLDLAVKWYDKAAKMETSWLKMR